MKPSLFLTLLLTMLCTCVRAQCPTGNVILETDAEVIAFANQWPNCTNLPNDLNIEVNVTDVTALSQLRSVDGTLTIRNTPLKDLNGLHNITTVTGGVGISAITSTGDLASVLLALETVGGQLNIQNNASLTGIQALENLTSVDKVNIRGNASLENLAGLDAIRIASELTITNNSVLATCDADGICAALDLPADDVTISNNDGNCANYFEVQASCTSADCPPNVEVSSNQEIADFVAAFPNCVDLAGNLTVNGPATSIGSFDLETVGGDALYFNLPISNLDNFELISVGGDLSFVSITGLISSMANGPLPLTSVGGTIVLQNLQQIENVAALQNVTSLGGVSITSCNQLDNLDDWQGVPLTGTVLGMSSMDNIENLDLFDPLEFDGVDFEQVNILNNALLEEISGIAGVGSIGQLLIQLNPSLDFCAVDGVCSALSGNGIVIIRNNLEGCNSVTEVQADCNPDLTALIDLYNATDGPNWTNNAGWIDGAAGTNSTPCDGTWHGVTCDGNGRVTELEMSSNQLTGTLPASLGQLNMLEFLSFTNNNLTGTIPEVLYALPRLERMFFTINNFTGGISASIGNAPALEHVVFTANPNLGGTIPAEITDCSTLRTFGAGGCGLTGSLPVINDGDLPNLRRLLVSDNDLSGTFSGNYGFLTQLERIELNDNNFNGLIPNIFATTPNLRTLHLENNGFINGLPLSLNQATNLEELKVSNNNLDGTLRPNLRDLVNLEIFEADGNAFTGGAPAFDQSPNLTIYNVAENDLDGLVPDGLLNSAILEEIDMSGNGFTGPLPLFPAGGTGARSFPSGNGALALISLDMADNNFAGCYPTEYSALCSGTTTDFSGNAGLPDGGSADGFTNEFCQDNSACGNLPVSWLGFSARPEGKVVHLHWRTAAEENNAGFTAQRSADGAAWTDLGEVAAGAYTYAYTDEAPLNGTSYYRIRQTDADGRFSFSVVASVRLTAAGAFAFPNPFTDRITVFSAVADEVEVYDAAGRKVLTYAHSGGGAQVQRMVLRPGVYTLRLRSSGRVSRVVAR